MIGAIIGDVVGSVYEFDNISKKRFKFFCNKCTFTDDTVMTLAVAESIMKCMEKEGNYNNLMGYAVEWMHKVGLRYPFCGYGGRFFRWMHGYDWSPYNSCGNGSAMRISAVGDIAKTVDEAKDLAYKLTAITHNHEEGLKGAEAAAVAKVLLKQGMSKNDVRWYIEKNYYKLDKTLDEYRRENNGQHGQEICQVTMPQAFECFFEGKDFEDVIRNCISIGGDSDTIAAIAGGIAEAYYPIPRWMKRKVKKYLPRHLKDILGRWEEFVIISECRA